MNQMDFKPKSIRYGSISRNINLVDLFSTWCFLKSSKRRQTSNEKRAFEIVKWSWRFNQFYKNRLRFKDKIEDKYFDYSRCTCLRHCWKIRLRFYFERKWIWLGKLAEILLGQEEGQYFNKAMHRRVWLLLWILRT